MAKAKSRYDDPEQEAAFNKYMGEQMLTFFTLCSVYEGIEPQDPPEPETSCLIPGCNYPATAKVNVGKLGSMDDICLCDHHLAKLNRLHDRVVEQGPALATFARQHQLTLDF